MFQHVAAAFAVALVTTTTASAQGSEQPIRLKFAAVVGSTPLACGQTYEGIGTTNSSISIVDFRFYVSRVRLLKPDGSEQAVTLKQDGLWQVDDVALLDFENGTTGCVNGTEQTRDFIEGRVPAGQYVGVRFDLGLPFDKNHRESTLQPSPLNLTRLFWTWNAGYKFLRMDLRTTGQPKGWMLHLGSTGCVPAGKATVAPESCTNRNVATIDLAAFAPSTDTIEFDLKTLLEASNVDANEPQTAIGCMSGQTDPECGPLFGKLGLAWGAAPASTQTAFRIRRPATTASGQR